MAEDIFEISIGTNLIAPGKVDCYVEASCVVNRLIFSLSDNSAIRKHHMPRLLYLFLIAPVDALQAHILHLESFAGLVVIRIARLLTDGVIDSFNFAKGHMLSTGYPI